MRNANKTGSGTLRFDGASIRYDSADYGAFDIALADVVLIGELTTDGGPFVDDWFLVFVLAEGRGWHEVSMYSEGIREVCDQLSAALGAAIFGTLFGSTDWASRIVWPEAIQDRPLFEFGPPTPRGMWHRIKLLMWPEISRSLSSDARSAIQLRH